MHLNKYIKPVNRCRLQTSAMYQFAATGPSYSKREIF